MSSTANQKWQSPQAGLRTVSMGMPTPDEVVTGGSRELSARPRLPETLGDLSGADASWPAHLCGRRCHHLCD